MICCVCNRERQEGQSLDIPQPEQALLRRATGQEIPSSYFYCKACWKILQNRTQGAQLLKGLMQANLSKLGVRNADRIADKYFQFLMKHAAKEPVS